MKKKYFLSSLAILLAYSVLLIARGEFCPVCGTQDCYDCNYNYDMPTLNKNMKFMEVADLLPCDCATNPYHMYLDVCDCACHVVLRNEITYQLPEIEVPSDYIKDPKEVKKALDGYEWIANVAQYKNADWSDVVGIARKISLEQALTIANNDPRVTFFFRITKGSLVLEKMDGDYRVFQRGDTVFFSGEPHWGTAGSADGFVKKG